MSLAWRWEQAYIDLRPTVSADQISLDLSRHLQYRLGTGTILVIASNPRIFLSVICRRWKNLLREVANLRSSTVDGCLRQLLGHELERLHGFSFSSKADAQADLVVTTPERAYGLAGEYSTLYITTPVGEDIMAIISKLKAGGLVVAYNDEPGYTKVS